MAPAIPEKIPCESIQSLRQEVSTLSDALSVTETEETWDRIERALLRFSAVIKGGGFKYENELVDSMKGLAKPINSAMNSERTRLSAAALECLTVIAPRLGLAFDALVPFFISHILRLSNRTNKVYVTRSQASVALIINYCHIPSIIHHLLVACRDSKIATGRVIAVEGIMRALNKWDWTQNDIKAKVGDVEEVIRLTGRDKDAGIRQTSRKVFEAYRVLFPERIEEFIAPLTPVMRKYLDITPVDRGRPVSKPNFSASTSAVPSTNGRTGISLQSRSTSSHAVKYGVTKASQRLRMVAPERMPPPPSVPFHTRLGPSTVRPDESDSHERERVLSNASSTFSVKSAPPNTRPALEHKPPARLASSQSRVNHASATSGPPRRVRRVIPVEPHPANLPDLFAVAREATICPSPAPRAAGVSFADKLRNGPVPTSNALGITFPSVDSNRGSAAVERKGPQRVPKPALPIPQSAEPVEPNVNANLLTLEVDSKAEAIPVNVEVVLNMDDAGKTLSVVQQSSDVAPKTGKLGKNAVSKKETKPSIFHRAAIKTDRDTAPPKAKEGFAPRRGGLMQPTLSQLSKQKPPVVNAPPRVRVMSSLNTKRPVAAPVVGKTSSNAKTVRNTTTKSPILKPDEEKDVVMPTPASLPVNEGDFKANQVPLPMSRVVLQNANTDTEQLAKVAVVDSSEPVLEEPSEPYGSSAITDANTPNTQPVEVSETGLDLSEESVPSASVESTPAPQTPPFPTSDEEIDDELEDIEFTTGQAYDPSGMSIKTPRKIVSTTTDGMLDRTPLREVVLNE